MTAIAAFNCSDGIVLAADTEESYGEDKAYAHKLFPVERKTSRLCVAGAGIGYIIDYANDQIVSALDSGINTIPRFRVALEDILEQLYEDKLKHYPVTSRSQLRMQLLVGVQFANENDQSNWMRPALFECQSNLVTPIQRTKQSCILGAGELLKQIGIQFAGWGLTTSLAEWISIYLIHEAKRRYAGVGGKTHTFVMRTDGTFSYNLGKKLLVKESVLDGFARTIQVLILSLDPSVPEHRAKDFVDAGVTWLRNARKDLQTLEREGDKASHTSITIHSREMKKIFKKLRSLKPSKS